MLHPETLLLVDDKEAKVLEAEILGQKAVRPNDQIDFPFLDPRDILVLLLVRNKARKHGDVDAKRREALARHLEVLAAKEGRGAKQSDLFSSGDGFENRAEGHFGLPEPDIAAKKAIHDFGGFHIGFDFINGFLLIRGQRIGKLRLELALQVVVWGKAETLVADASPIKGDEAIREFVDPLPDLSFFLVPILSRKTR